MSHVLVVGSSNTDLVMNTPRLPSPGETLLGATFFSVQGGKGANQAVAAARAGAKTTFIARMGNDDFGQQALLSLQKENIHTDHVLLDPDLPSGVAFILVDNKGENSIIVASGANAALSPIQLETAKSVFEHADICLLQLETPIDTVLYATQLASQCHTPVILNPAPATQLPNEIWPHLFLITPNETETEMLTGISPNTDQNAQNAAQILLDRGVQNVIITLGARGALLVTPTQTHHIAAPFVTPIDTTAAGDAFNGALAYALSNGQSLAEATHFACVAGALTVTQAGAQPAIPTASQIWQLLKNQ